MKTAIFLKKVTIIDPNSPFNKQTKDLLIENGMVVKVANDIKPPAGALIIEEDGLHICPGLFDLLVDFGEPGFEERETISNGLVVAASSGFTDIALNSNTFPVIDSHSDISFVISNSSTKKYVCSRCITGSNYFIHSIFFNCVYILRISRT